MSDAVDLPDKVTPIEPGEPVEAFAVHTQPSTFAERKAAREAAEGKVVDQAAAEDKAVKPRSTRRK